MKKDEVERRVVEFLDDLGIKKSTSSVAKIPSCVEVKVIAGGEQKTVKLRSGIPGPDLELELDRIRAFVVQREGTVDLEEAIRERA